MKKDIILFIKSIKNGLDIFSQNIITLVNALLLSLVYFIGVGITKLFTKLQGKRLLDTNIDKNKETYWQQVKEKSTHIDEYYKQF